MRRRGPDHGAGALERRAAEGVGGRDACAHLGRALGNRDVATQAH